MPAVTIELPEEVAVRFHALPPEERDAFAVAAIEEHLDRRDEDEADLIAAVNEGLEDVRLGRTRPFEEFTAEVKARFVR